MSCKTCKVLGTARSESLRLSMKVVECIHVPQCEPLTKKSKEETRTILFPLLASGL